MQTPPPTHPQKMNAVDFNAIFSRTAIFQQIKDILLQFDAKCRDVNYKKGIYVYGSPGCGKTHFVAELLKSMNYDAIRYDAGDVRNKSLIELLTSNNVGQCNVLDLMRGKPKKIAIVMDEIDGMHKGDKGGISALVKLIRQKKTKKQKAEHQTLNPVICIGNYYMDKKIRELMKVCYTFELPTPTDDQMREVIDQMMPGIDAPLRGSMVRFVQGDFRKLQFLWNLHQKKPEALSRDNIENIFHMKYYNEDYARIVEQMFKTNVPLDQHNSFMNENDRTTVALLWHENVVDRLAGLPKTQAFPLYQRIVDNICFADYMDRITFQNQIWIFNEMSSLTKTFYNNKIYHDYFDSRDIPKDVAMDIRFTKILTKYSTEYSNMIFAQMLAQEMDLDKKDVAGFFQEMRLFYGRGFADKNEQVAEVEKLFADTAKDVPKIKKLDIKRMYRFLDKNVKRENGKELDDDEFDEFGCDE